MKKKNVSKSLGALKTRGCARIEGKCAYEGYILPGLDTLFFSMATPVVEVTSFYYSVPSIQKDSFFSRRRVSNHEIRYGISNREDFERNKSYYGETTNLCRVDNTDRSPSRYIFTKPFICHLRIGLEYKERPRGVPVV